MRLEELTRPIKLATDTRASVFDTLLSAGGGAAAGIGAQLYADGGNNSLKDNVILGGLSGAGAGLGAYTGYGAGRMSGETRPLNMLNRARATAGAATLGTLGGVGGRLLGEQLVGAGKPANTGLGLGLGTAVGVGVVGAGAAGLAYWLYQRRKKNQERRAGVKDASLSVGAGAAIGAIGGGYLNKSRGGTFNQGAARGLVSGTGAGFGAGLGGGLGGLTGMLLAGALTRGNREAMLISGMLGGGLGACGLGRVGYGIGRQAGRRLLGPDEGDRLEELEEKDRKEREEKGQKTGAFNILPQQDWHQARQAPKQSFGSSMLWDQSKSTGRNLYGHGVNAVAGLAALTGVGLPAAGTILTVGHGASAATDLAGVGTKTPQKSQYGGVWGQY